MTKPEKKRNVISFENVNPEIDILELIKMINAVNNNHSNNNQLINLLLNNSSKVTVKST